MKKNAFSTLSPGRVLQLLVFAAALMLLGCDNKVEFSPTAPRPPYDPAVGDRSLQISGKLTSDQGGCVEATVLFDGRELPGARSTCPKASGCAELELAAETSSKSGRHTISFRVLEQSTKRIEYRARGAVRVDRDGLNFGGVQMLLGPETATLRSGQSVDFEVVFTD